MATTPPATVRVFRKRDGRTLSFTYDNLNRVTAKLVPAGCAPIQVGACPPASATRSVYYGYDVRGLQTYARFDSASGDGVTSTYDGFGRQTASTMYMNGVARTLSYQYDVDGNRLRITHPDGIYYNAGYDAGDRMVSGEWWAPAVGTKPFLAIAYDNLGRRSSTARGATSTTYAYDAISRPVAWGQRFPVASNNLNDLLAYNPADQIVSDARDNDTYVFTGAVALTRNYAVNGLNQYTTAGPATFTYDANGNLISDGTSSWVYDAENRMVSSSQATVAYDPLGRLWQTQSAWLGTTLFLHDGDHIAVEYDGASGAVARRYFWGPGVDEPILQNDGVVMDGSVTRNAPHRPSGLGGRGGELLRWSRRGRYLRRIRHPGVEQLWAVPIHRPGVARRPRPLLLQGADVFPDARPLPPDRPDRV